MTDCKIHVLGAEWTILIRKKKQDKALKMLDGYCDYTIRTIVVRKHPKPSKAMDMENPNSIERESLRHEIIHAFLHESGLANSSCGARHWATNEEMTDWIALQHEKIHKAFKEAGAL